MISEPMVHSAQTVHLSCVEIDTILKQTEMSFHLTYVTQENPRGVPKAILEPMVHSVQTALLSYTKKNTISKQTKTRSPLTHVT
jgi:dTDP-glucose pyrophosphorylase